MAASGSTRKRGRYRLDTNIVTALFKQDTTVHAELAAAEQVLLSSTVLGELYFGAARSGRPQQNREQLEEFAATCIILAVDHSRHGWIRGVVDIHALRRFRFPPLLAPVPEVG